MTVSAVPTASAKQKLVELKKHMPQAPDDMVYRFGRFLAPRLNPTLVPAGFVNACLSALHDLELGIDSHTSEPFRSDLTGYPHVIYVLLSMDIPDIALAVFPADFADEVKTYLANIEQLAKASHKGEGHG